MAWRVAETSFNLPNQSKRVPAKSPKPAQFIPHADSNRLQINHPSSSDTATMGCRAFLFATKSPLLSRKENKWLDSDKKLVNYVFTKIKLRTNNTCLLIKQINQHSTQCVAKPSVGKSQDHQSIGKISTISPASLSLPSKICAAPQGDAFIHH